MYNHATIEGLTFDIDFWGVKVDVRTVCLSHEKLVLLEERLHVSRSL